jgi:hypothetical protein
MYEHAVTRERLIRSCLPRCLRYLAAHPSAPRAGTNILNIPKYLKFKVQAKRKEKKDFIKNMRRLDGRLVNP